MRSGSAVLVAALTSLGVLAVPISAHAVTGVTYYASPGTTGDCLTSSTPCSLFTAFSKAENAGAGNLVSLASGTYAPSSALDATAAITLEAASGATPEIDGDGSDPIVDDSAALTVTGLVLDGGSEAVVVESAGNLTFTDSTASNSSDDGLTVYGSATVANSNLTGNDGDGISVAGTATVSDTTASGNGADGFGLVAVSGSTPAATITESTSYGNGENGLAVGNGGAANIYSSSVVGNHAHEFDTASSGTIKAGGDLLADNQDIGGDCAGETGAPHVTDAGYNISDDSTCSFGGTSGDPTTLDASIGAFDQYGGPTSTIMISQSSPAATVVAGTPSGTTAICGTPDQRGLTRPAAPCAAGSFDPNAATVHSTTTIEVSPDAATDTMTVIAAVIGSVGQSSGGTVEFLAAKDGGSTADVPGCAAVAVSVGTASCVATVTPVHSYQFVADFSGSRTYNASASALSASFKAFEASTTTITVDSANHVTATVTLLNAADPQNAPTGSVSFTIGSASAVSAPLTASGTATATATAGLTVISSLSNPTSIAAAYHGDSNFASSSATTATKRPTLVAHLSSSKPKSKYGWYHTVVVVNWTCAPGTGNLVSCPSPTTLSVSKARETTTKTIHNSIGGTVTTTSAAVNIDRVKPTIKISKVVRGHTYRKHTTVHPKCTAKDTLSGLAGACKVKITHKKDGKRTAYTATVTATDKAGNKTVKTIGWKKKR
jgi:hypothetical protein